MPADELIHRIKRIYASIDALQELDLAKLPAQVMQSDRLVAIFQDFKGNLSHEEIENAAYTVIHNIANLQDHMRRWAHHNGHDKARVDDAFKASAALKIVKDLSNNDKHGPPRDGGHSGVAPMLSDVRRVMQLRTEAKAGSFVAMTLGARGEPKVTGTGTAGAIITAEVVDKDENLLGDLFDIQKQAVTAWETLLEELGVLKP